MHVSDAVARRKSVRQFLPDPVDDAVLRDLLDRAARAPSGGNVQPWRIYVINGDAMDRFRGFIADRPIEAGEYDIYPANLWEPYRTNRFALGEAMYAAQQAEGGSDEGGSDDNASSDEDVVDAEYSEVDGDDKKSA